MAYHEMLPQEILDLQKELKNWPLISTEAMQAESFQEQLATIAARLQILLDGVYDPLDLCKMLTKKLYEMRTQLILPTNTLASKMTTVKITEGENTVTLDNVPESNELVLPESLKKEE